MGWNSNVDDVCQNRGTCSCSGCRAGVHGVAENGVKLHCFDHSNGCHVFC